MELIDLLLLEGPKLSPKHKMSEMESPEVLNARFEQLSVLETEFEEVENEISESGSSV